MYIGKLADDYDSLGFAVIKGFLTKKQVTEVLDEFQRFLDTEAPLLKGREINYADEDRKVLNSIHNLASTPGNYFHSLLHSPRVIDLGSQFLRGQAKARAAEMFAKPAGKGLPSPLHQDNFYWCLQPCDAHTALTIWVALDPANPSNGGVTYLAGSHKLGLIEHTDSNAPGSSQMVKDQTIIARYENVSPSLEPGDALVHDSMTLHYSAANTSGNSRRGMTLQLQRENAQVDPIRLKIYEDRLAAQIAKRSETTNDR